MINSILAGVMICIGAVAALGVGWPVGPFVFTIGLLTILRFKLDLFTGKAGLLLPGKISPWKLILVWIGNLLGAMGTALDLRCVKLGAVISDRALPLLESRVSALWYENIIAGILCGVLMYVAVSAYQEAPWMSIMAVAAFIFAGGGHCVADMVYMGLAVTKETLVPAATALIWTTIGNVIGCNLLHVRDQG